MGFRYLFRTKIRASAGGGAWVSSEESCQKVPGQKKKVLRSIPSFACSAAFCAL